MLREGGWESASGHMLGGWCPFLAPGLLAFTHPSLVTLPRDRALLPFILSSVCFPVWLLGWVQLGQCWLWPAGGGGGLQARENGSEGRRGWGLGGEAVRHLDILNGSGPNFLKRLGMACLGTWGPYPPTPVLPWKQEPEGKSLSPCPCSFPAYSSPSPSLPG